MYHALYPPHQPMEKPTNKWSQMVQVLEDYVNQRDYTLAAAFHYTPSNTTHYYWVRKDFPESREITEKIRNTQYRWGHTGNIAENQLQKP
jgi:hypothetical protein